MRFNKETTGTRTVNLAGGKAYTQTPEMEMVSILLTSFVKDQYYKSADDTMLSVRHLLDAVDPKFAAKAAVYARNEFGLRSITHVLAGEIAKHISGTSWGKDFYSAVIRRPDDMMEILSYYKSMMNGKTVPHAMKKGFAKAFDKFDGYQLAKYRGEKKSMKLVDVVNLVHPIPIDNNKDALNQLVNGTLRSTSTWESKLTQAGQNATSDAEKEQLKSDSWKELVLERKIGYFALLRNLRNILEQAPEIIDNVCELLTDEKLIKKSLVLPFRYVQAISAVSNVSESNSRKVMVSINKAIDVSCSNVPRFDGRTLVVADYSGSMGEGVSSYKGQASLFGAILARANDADFMIFGDSAAYININPLDSTMTNVERLMEHNKYSSYAGGSGANVGHGTNFHSIFTTANKKYDRIFIFSDMQGWVGHGTPVHGFEKYRSKYSASPFVYSIDLAGYGSMQFPQDRIYALAGFSEKIFDLIKLLETDRNALINRINEVSF